MKASESIAKLSTALCKAQEAMGGAVKDSANPFFKSKYADLGSVVRAIKQPFAENGLSYVQFPIAEENRIGISTRLMHTSGEWLEESFAIPMAKIDPQQAGSVLTYFRRYSLAAIAGVPQVDDDAEAAMFQARKTLDDWKRELAPSINAINDALDDGDLSTAAEAWFELSDEEKHALWVAPTKGGPFSTSHRDTMKSPEFRKAYYGEEAA
jgi:hypothetical protein